jgi:hypothetical protein
MITSVEKLLLHCVTYSFQETGFVNVTVCKLVGKGDGVNLPQFNLEFLLLYLTHRCFSMHGEQHRQGDIAFTLR